MNDAEHDDYLWNRGGPVDLEVVKIERKLETLAWRPQPLVLPLAIGAPEPVPRSSIRPAIDRSRGRVGSAWIAGLAMAATVLSAVYLARHKTEDPAPATEPESSVESIDPAGQPQRSPDLRDPFSSTRNMPAGTAGNLLDPFGPPREQTPTAPTHPELKDPFSGKAAPPAVKPAQGPADVSSDLKDPFRRSKPASPQSEPSPILDPFHGSSSPPSKPSKDSGSELADPFANQH